MIRRSWRARVTGWYVLLLAIVVATLAGGGWWLMSRSVIDAADRDLTARLRGLRGFIDGMQAETNPQEVVDEFREYGELTSGESLIEVIDPAGRVLVRPPMPWWADVGRGPAGDTPAFRTWRGGPRELRVVDAAIDAGGRRYLVTIAVPTAALRAAVDRFGTLLAVLAPIVLLVAGAGVFAISRRALAPVDEIRQAAEAITVDRLDRRLVVPDVDDDLRRLVVTFNDMLAGLERAVANIVRFTADASHELRTPVALIRTTADLALDRDRTPDQYRQALSDVAADARRLSTLVDDLLRLARADAGVDTAIDEPCDLAVVVAAVAADGAAAAAAAGVAVTVQAPAAPVFVAGPDRSVARMIRALVENALKYTPRGGRLTLVVSVDESSRGTAAGLVRVSDTGDGVTPADAPRIFDRFFRGRDARARGLEGSGLGLSLARTLAEHAGGSIRLVTPSDLGGATFEVRLPAVGVPRGIG